MLSRNCTLVDLSFFLDVNSYHAASFAACESEIIKAYGTYFPTSLMNLRHNELTLVQSFSYYLLRKGGDRIKEARS